MSENNMKRLGDYIRPVDVRNRNLKVTRLVGLTIDKAFIPSVANTIGTDLSNYKVISENQFACSLMQVSRDGKMPIAMFKGEPCIMSPAYPMFEVSKTNELLPEYLMMWFSRSEFDREASFYAVGGVRGSLEWNDFCDMRIPVPAIEKQREIVAEYNTLATRIETNKKLIATLEQTAQTLYRHIFVDNIDPNNLPDGWRMGTLGEVCTFKYGKLPSKHEKSVDYPYPVFSGYAITGYTDEYTLDDSEIVVIARGDAGTGKICMSPEKCFLSNLAIAAIANDRDMKLYLYYHLLTLDTMSLRSGTAQAQITISSLEPFEVMLPPKATCKEFSDNIKVLLKTQENYNTEIQTLTQIQTLFLSKMGA
jgi:type I restriction enzyme S subunit